MVKKNKPLTAHEKALLAASILGAKKTLNYLEKRKGRIGPSAFNFIVTKTGKLRRIMPK